MSSPITSLSSSYLQSIINSAIQNAASTTSKTANNLSGTSATPAAQQSDSNQLSPAVRLMNTLQQLQQTDPAKYQQVTQQIAANLQSAAQAAQSAGNTTAASQLNQLSTDFTKASTSDQLPNIQDLAQAVGGHHHHHGHASSTETAETSGAASSSSASGTNQTLSQLLSAFEANGSSNTASDPMSIILNTLSSSGVGASNL